MDSPLTIKVALSTRDEDTGEIYLETFPALVVNDTECLIRNIPLVTKGLSYNDVMARNESKTSWKIVTKSRYSTILVVPVDDLQTDAGKFVLDERLETIQNLPGMILYIRPNARSYAVLPENFRITEQILEAGEGTFWNWALLSDRTNL